MIEHWLENTLPVVAVVTNISYGCVLFLFLTLLGFVTYETQLTR